jgi:hypothetical protein
MTGRLLDIDDSGTVETFEFDDETETAIIRRQADVQPVIDRNRELENHGPRNASAVMGSGAPGELDARLVASIPIEVAYLWLQRYGVCAWKKEHWDKVKKLLNDNEWRYLRCNSLVL